VRLLWAILASCLVVGAVRAEVSPAGLVPLPCKGGALLPVSDVYCKRQRHFVTPGTSQILISVADGLARAHPGAVVHYMEASWPSGIRPMPPHFSHGDGRQVDLALFYEDGRGHSLPGPPVAPGPPIAPGYGAYEPPSRPSERACVGIAGHHDRPDPPANRTWRLDEVRTKDLIRRLVASPQVRRIFLEPHLKARLGFAGSPKVRFAGCASARHDDHIHVDFNG
jgi:hypothetical protein